MTSDSCTLPPSSILADLRSGWAEFTSRTWLWVGVVAIGLVNAAFQGSVQVIGPTIANASPDFGPRGWGLCVAALGAGTILMTLVMMQFRLERPLLVGIGTLFFACAPVLALSLHPTVLVVALAMGLVGISFEVLGTGWNVALQENVPQEALSRVSSYDFLGSYLLGPIGLMFYGWAGAHLPHRELLLVTAAVLAVLIAWPLLIPSVRRLRRAPREAPPLP